MTSPDNINPAGAVGALGAFSAKTQEDWESEQQAGIMGHFDIPFLSGAIAELMEVISGVEDADSGDVGSFVNLLLGRDESLASRVARIENKIALGAEFFDDFNRGDNDTVIGNGWSQGGDGQGLGIHDQAVQIKRDLLPDDGTRYAICPQVADGDSFTVAAVIHPAGVAANPETVLYARANTGFTAGVCVRMRAGLTRISRWTRSGVTFSYTDVGPAGTKFYSNSATVEFKGSGTTLQAVIDGVLVVDTTDATHTIGAANRTVGFSAQCWTGILAVPQYSGGLASFAMRSAVTLTAVQQAAADAAAASSAASTANTNASAAVTTANSKSKITRASSAPSSPATGDKWEDNTLGDDKVIFKTWNGSTWTITIEKLVTELNDLLTSGDDVQIFTANGTWTKPAGAKRVFVFEHGPGAGGGRGTGAGGSDNSNGAGGGPGGWQRGYMFSAGDLTSTVAVTVPLGGVGGTSDGAAGTTTSAVTFGSYLSAGPGTGRGSATVSNLTGNAGSGVESGLLLNFGGMGGRSGLAANPGGAGPFSAGGTAGSGTGGAAGGNGADPPSSLLFGPGGGGGGGAYKSGTGNGGNGGNGGLGAGGGGGGAYATFGTDGNGGAGGNGKAWIVTQFF